MAIAVGVVLAAPVAAHAEVHVSSLIGDHMVVQQGRPVRLTGTDVPGQTVRSALAGGKTTTAATTTPTTAARP